MRWMAASITGLVFFLAMEPWARLLHGKIWHGPLIGIHRSHHTRRVGRFEKNDWLSGLHAPIATALIMVGCNVEGALGGAMFGAGVGMTLFGLSYVLVHDGLVHGRLPVGFLARVPWLRRVRDAHRVHHAHGGAPYGLFLGPRELMRARAARAASPSASPRAVPAPSGRRRRPPASASTYGEGTR